MDRRAVPSRTVRTAVGRAAVAVLAIGCGNVLAQSSGQPSGSQGSSPEKASDDASDSPNALATGNDSLRLTIAGQVNRAVLFYDDGRGSGAIHVDNDNSSSRLRFAAESTTFDALAVGAVIEVEFQSNPSNLVSQEDQRGVGSNTFDERRFEVFVKSDTWGNPLLGQGSTASDGTAEVDLSGTGVAGYSDVDDTGGGLAFMSGGVSTGTDVRGVFANLDGLGRDDRLRYDSPRLGDLVASVSFAADRARDVALRWERDPDAGTWKAAAALSHADLGDGDADADGDIGADTTTARTTASASLSLDNGLNLTVMAGRAASSQRDPRVGYIKLGYRFSPFALGETAVSIDHHVSDEIVRGGERATSTGLQLVQTWRRFDASIFAVLRTYDYDAAANAFAKADGSFPAGLGPDSEAARIDVAMIGVRVPF